ncbi:MAG: sigma 54-interacting transcriptional regulator, partial [Deltaproteobacteria bacterium]|nr:sigma 54-interacting transcriptional regulator [Deltaproteobacteria bacterium]
MKATVEATRDGSEPAGRGVARPGVVVVFAAGRAVLAPIALRGAELAVGRATLADLGLDDDSVSRRHARVAFDGRRWAIADEGSRNGTFADADRVSGEHVRSGVRVLRLGRTVSLLATDLLTFEGGVEVRDGVVVGPSLRSAWSAVERAARAGDTVHLVGETGAGKEIAARRFHAAGPRPKAPFVAVNCAAIPDGLAERLLFGAVRGAYSGASTDASGYVQAADSGTLFLDEVAELDLRVQSKLLRVLEAREVLPLGATKPQPVAIRVCSATHRDLRAAVAEGAFRQDLYFRLGRPDVRIPPLRERLEEIPHLVARVTADVDARLTPHATTIERCLLLPWPGNVRELVAEVRRAATEALGAGRTIVMPEDLSASAGAAFAPSAVPDASNRQDAPSEPPSRERIEEAL